ncbi:MAG: endonuclease III [Defluviitaleaceae bacterium]|nr:endonuclease III [Defluviitaleaceae bacterium]
MILQILDELYPFDGKCFLHYDAKKPWQLLFATILSAQCTDARVNEVTTELFKKFPTLESFAIAEISEIEAAVRPTGFFRNKARHLQGAAQLLLSEHGGILPSDLERLTGLPGVGRKTANVVRSHIFKIPCIVVDTHVSRVSRRLGLAKEKCPVKIEHELMHVLPMEHHIRFNQQVISHGRLVCSARNPRCENCALKSFCTYVIILQKEREK